ncbi:hypothetical protein EV363DRAFT_1498103 [Boletus edulis]|nr:hypothetical protein EV363DRAFT_1498103 [Boletus edulis]
MSDWTLHYWIRGQPLDAWHTIQVSPEIDTLDLKRFIYNTHHKSLTGKPSTIHIYKVPDNKPVLWGDSTEHTLDALTLDQLNVIEFTGRDLLKYFKPPIPRNQLHLIISTSFNICCWLRGTDSTSAFIIHSSIADQISKLKKTIRTKLYDLGHSNVPTHFLRLYKILPSDNLETFYTPGSGQVLDRHEYVGDVFNDVPFSATPCVVIDCVDDGFMIQTQGYKNLLKNKRRLSIGHHSLYLETNWEIQ